ncbi:MAG TPA: hypothetical protein VK841_12805 [Polyangiaceae bacterium]|jgi:hypothetical protein|nr:hypothetical protein [Polyangiaceae bacterium]
MAVRRHVASGLAWAAAIGFAVGCGSSASGGAASGTSSGTSAAGSSGAGAAGSSGTSAGTGTASGAASGASSSGVAGTASGGATGTSGTGGTPPASDGGCGTTPEAGNGSGSCSTAIPAAGQAADASNATVIGKGTPASCTFSALNAAVAQGGAITFNCGCAPLTIAVTATMNLPIAKDTVIDGGNKITLDGGNAVQILNFNSPNYQANETRVTLQHIAFVNAKTNPVDMIPSPPPQPACSQGYDDGAGGAIYMRDGNLTVVDSIFTNNRAAPVGPDTGGGAIYVTGSKHGIVIVSSTFTNNSGSNAGAVGALNAELDVYNSTFSGNTATGHDANNNDPSECTQMNNGQNEVGSGGNGGALYSDGNSINVIVCGDSITGNAAGTNAFAGGVFMTSDNLMGDLTITDSTITGNTGGSWGGAGTAIGVNAKTITITDSTVQGYP